MPDWLDVNIPSIATGLFSLSNSLPNAAEIYQRCMEITEMWSKYLVNPEQAVLNIVFQEKGIAIERLDWNYAFNVNIHSLGSESDEAIYCLHSVGQPKFWNGYYNETWQNNYRDWLDMGGRPWKNKSSFSLKKLKKMLLFFYFRVKEHFFIK